MTNATPSTDAWKSSPDRIDELCEMGDYQAADAALVAAIGETVLWQGREYKTADLLLGRLVETAMDTARQRTRGWLGGMETEAIPHERYFQSLGESTQSQ